MDLVGLVELLFVGLGAVGMNLTLWGMVWVCVCIALGLFGLVLLG